jgi:hypothetical protein
LAAIRLYLLDGFSLCVFCFNFSIKYIGQMFVFLEKVIAYVDIKP